MLIVSICIEQSTRIKRLKTKTWPFFFWQKMAKNLTPSSRKWRKKNQIGENGGERKINPSANPVDNM